MCLLTCATSASESAVSEGSTSGSGFGADRAADVDIESSSWPRSWCSWAVIFFVLLPRAGGVGQKVMSLMALPNSPLERIEALCVGKGVDLSLEKSPSGCKIWKFGGQRGSLARMTQANRGARADAGECDLISVLARLALIYLYNDAVLHLHGTRSYTAQVSVKKRAKRYCCSNTGNES